MKTFTNRLIPLLALAATLNSGCGKATTLGSEGGIPCNSAVASWTAPTLNSDGSPLTDLAGYRLDYGTTPYLYANSIDIQGAGTTTATIPNLANNTTYYFVVQAVNSAGAAGAFSNQASKTINCSGSVSATNSAVANPSSSGFSIQ